MKTYKRITCLLLCITMVMPLATVVANQPADNPVAIQGLINFNPSYENVLEAFERANPFIDLSGATVTEEVDTYGNPVFLIEISREEVFSEATLADFAPTFLNDYSIYDAEFVEGILTYTLLDGTQGLMVEAIDYLGRRTISITEGELSNKVVFDSTNNQVIVDGEVATIYKTEVFVVHRADTADFGARWQQWSFFMEQRVNIRAEQAIRNLAIATIVTLVTSGFTVRIAILFGTATNIRDAFSSNRPFHDAIYATRRWYHNPGWSQFRLVDSFYTWNARNATQRITTRVAYNHTFS